MTESKMQRDLPNDRHLPNLDKYERLLTIPKGTRITPNLSEAYDLAPRHNGRAEALALLARRGYLNPVGPEAWVVL